MYLSLITLLYILFIQLGTAAICIRLQHNSLPSSLLILYRLSISYAYFNPYPANVENRVTS